MLARATGHRCPDGAVACARVGGERSRLLAFDRTWLTLELQCCLQRALVGCRAHKSVLVLGPDASMVRHHSPLAGLLDR